MQKEIEQFKGLYLNGGSLNTSLDYTQNFTGQIRPNEINSTQYEAKKTAFSRNLSESTFFEYIILDDDKYSYNDDLENIYKYNPQEYLLVQSKDKIYLYDENNELVFTYFYSSLISNIENIKGVVYILFENKEFYILSKIYNKVTKTQEITLLPYYNEIERDTIDILEVIKDKQLEEIIYSVNTYTDGVKQFEPEYKIVPQESRNKANGYYFIRFDIIRIVDNLVVDKLLFMFFGGNYYLIPYTENKISSKFKKDIYAYTITKNYFNLGIVCQIYTNEGNFIPLSPAPTIEMMENHLNPANIYSGTKTLLSNSKIKLIRPITVDIPTTDTSEINIAETILYRDGTELLNRTQKISLSEQIDIGFKVLPYDIYSNQLIIGRKIYVKMRNTDSYQLIYSLDKFKQNIKLSLSNENFEGIYLEQTLGITNPNIEQEIRKFDSFIIINGIMFITFMGEVYYPIIGNGAISKNFYNSNAIQEITDVKFLSNINGDLGVINTNSISIISINSEEGALYFIMKDTVGIKINDEKDFIDTPDGLIILTKKGLIAINGQNSVSLSEAITDVIIENYTKFNIFYSLSENKLFLYSKEVIYIYDFYYKYWTKNLISGIIYLTENFNGDLLGIKEDGVYKFTETTNRYSIYTTHYFNFFKYIKLNSIYFLGNTDTKIKINGKEYTIKDTILKVRYPGNTLKEKEQISFEYKGKINKIIIDYEGENIQ